MEGQWNANEREVAEIKAIASSQSDSPVLMININKYNDGEYPNGETYRNLSLIHISEPTRPY